jgi:hypothetical protein
MAHNRNIHGHDVICQPEVYEGEGNATSGSQWKCERWERDDWIVVLMLSVMPFSTILVLESISHCSQIHLPTLTHSSSHGLSM